MVELLDQDPLAAVRTRQHTIFFDPEFVTVSFQKRPGLAIVSMV